MLSLAKPAVDNAKDFFDKIIEIRKDLVSVPDLYKKKPTTVEQAVLLLNSHGLKPISTEVNIPNPEYRSCFVSQVISTDPKANQKVLCSTTVRVEYITQEKIDASKRMFEELEARKNEAALQRKNKSLEMKQKTKQAAQNVRSKVQQIHKEDDHNEPKEE